MVARGFVGGALIIVDVMPEPTLARYVKTSLENAPILASLSDREASLASFSRAASLAAMVTFAVPTTALSWRASTTTVSALSASPSVSAVTTAITAVSPTGRIRV